jgi:molecular chaperone HscB
MNYFELFDIPVKLKVERALLHPKYIALSRKYHPDYFARDSDAKISEVMEITALVNKAYKTFQEPDATIKYVLQLKGLLEEEEKYQLPGDFLAEVMDINEQLMDLGQLPAAGQRPVILALQSAIHQLQTEIYEPVKEIIEHYQEDLTTKEELLQVKAYYYKKKYLDRMSRELTGKL